MGFRIKRKWKNARASRKVPVPIQRIVVLRNPVARKARVLMKRKHVRWKPQITTKPCARIPRKKAMQMGELKSSLLPSLLDPMEKPKG